MKNKRNQVCYCLLQRANKEITSGALFAQLFLLYLQYLYLSVISSSVGSLNAIPPKASFTVPLSINESKADQTLRGASRYNNLLQHGSSTYFVFLKCSNKAIMMFKHQISFIITRFTTRLGKLPATDDIAKRIDYRISFEPDHAPITRSAKRLKAGTEQNRKVVKVVKTQIVKTPSKNAMRNQRKRVAKAQRKRDA
ncbi:PREDICTED: uncharacterized protein LOC101309119 [Fragaria vesca subsp. vesca]|uniref:uncharacterized protein LOC101309119 n=1 Tax=Fragaria vesca subsp. vesca TaxID=101020 RepID=UPI0002C2F4F6|nr:PREDICTED: uncharacterized protein LOC101309119 [Fragaria vesca subsp. vesca]